MLRAICVSLVLIFMHNSKTYGQYNLKYKIKMEYI